MSKLNIMTWNVDWFRNGNRSNCVKPWEYYINDCSKEICDKIVNVVKNFLVKENAIVILQEVPYKIFDEKNRKWEIHYLWKMFCNSFPENEYKIFRTSKREKILRNTIAIAKIDAYKEFNCFIDNNCIICIENGIAKIIGVHMKTHFKKDDESDNMWNELIKYTKSSEDDNLIIAGDFNAFIGCQEKLTEERYLELLQYMGNCTPENIITYGKNSIDKILLKKGRYFENCEYKMIPQPSKEYSDHKYLIMELDIVEEK